MSSARNGAPGNKRFVPRVEGLEDRTVPAGNVTVTVADDTLYVTGDAAGNSVWIAGNTRRGAVIRALDGTTINGAATPLFVRGFDDVVVRLNGGDDKLFVTTSRYRGEVTADLGAGNDLFFMLDAGHRGDTLVLGGDGDDTVLFSDSQFRRSVAVNTGPGNDQIGVKNIGVVDFWAANIGGTDFFNNEGSTIVRPHFIGVFNPGERPAPAPPKDPAPTPTLTTAAADPTSANPIGFTATFDEDVTGFDAADLLLTNATVASFTPVDARTYTFALAPTAQGAVSVSVAANGATDAAGNGNVASNTVSRTFDTIAPSATVTPLRTNDTTPIISGTVNDPDATVRVTVNGHTYTAAVSSTGVWAAAVTDPLPQNTYAVTATATDRAGNVGTATSPSGLVIDLTPPQVGFSANPDSPVNGSQTLVTITFNEAVTGFTAADVTVSNGSRGTFTPISPTEYRVVVATNRDGTATVSLAQGAGQDAAGNGSDAGSFDVTFDTGQPTLDLAAASDSGPVGDLRTDHSTVTLTGTTRPLATVRLYATTVPGTPGTGTPIDTVTADATGAFNFLNVTLAPGPNSFTVQATDTANTVSNTFTQTFTRNTAPTATPIADQPATVGTPLTIPLAGVFDDAETVVRFAVSYPNGQTGTIDINLFDDTTPLTVANFLNYANATGTQSYDGTVFHRKITDFVLQGGGFKFVESGTDTTSTFPPINVGAPTVQNEPEVSNTRGTIAMAKGSNPDSATSEFFFNLDDNSVALNSAANAGGFTVFGQVMNGGLTVLDAIEALEEYPGPAGLPGAPPFPVSASADTTDFPQNITAADVARITDASVLSTVQKLSFVVTDDDPTDTIATASVTNGELIITPLAAGTIVFTITATDLDGSSVTATVKVDVTN